MDLNFYMMQDVLKLEVQMLMTYFSLSEKKYEGKQPLCKINVNKILRVLDCFQRLSRDCRRT